MKNIDETIKFSKKLKLLYVEDDSLARESIKMVLEEFFYDVAIATNGEEGLVKFRESSVDLIITDINMPKLNGLEMIEKIREDDKDIPIMILSAYTELEYFTTGIKLGVDGYLLKPFDLEQFMSTMTNIISKIELQEVQNELHRKHEYLQAIVNGVKDPIMVIKSDYTVEIMNESLRRHLNSDTVADIERPKCYELSHHRSTPCDGSEHQCPLQDVLESKKPMTVVHKHKDIDDKDCYIELAVVPLFDLEEECVGIIESSRDITAHLEAQDKLREQSRILDHQASHDHLTGLPNRILFMDRLTHAIERSARDHTEFALFFIDLDRFKHINDTLGHKVGDEVLQEVSNRLNGIIRKEDTLARLGGDEFTILMERLRSGEDASILAQKILDLLAEPIYISDHILYISSSIGISLYPQDDSDASNLLKYADTAMYQAKDEGRDNFQYYSAEMTAIVFERMEMEGNLRQAIKREEFLIYYQPQFNGKDGKIIGLEALVRWQSPTMGLVSPDRFMSVAEETRVIITIDQWVMKRAMRQIVQWYDAGYSPGVLSLNITMQQLYQPSFPDMLTKMMRETGLKAKWLELEIIENKIMTNPDEAVLILQQISDMGIELAIDDFGTGYSSLSYLKRLPINKLKIDKSFVKNLPNDEDDAGIVKAIIALSESLNLKVIAEGVETEAQQKFLIDSGCQNMQGYLYGKPMPSDEMEMMLKEGSV
ncbi:MAG: EAL domain-containing protein [Campylobacterota bacterium]|nr:EAL domain-containing protein [Campylobacterota bacterium]